MTDTHSVPLTARAITALAAATDERYAATCPECGSDLLVLTFLNGYQCPKDHSLNNRHELDGVKWWHGRLPPEPAAVLAGILYLVLHWRHGDDIAQEALPDG